MNKHALVSAIAAALLCGCTTSPSLNDTSIFSLHTRNVIERDLSARNTAPIASGRIYRDGDGHFVTAVPSEIEAAFDSKQQAVREPMPDEPTEGTKEGDSPLSFGEPAAFIDFGNDMVVPEEIDPVVAKILAAAGAAGQVYVIGFSHGRSVVGVDRLSTDRANVVRAALVDGGIAPERIHTLASWGGHAVAYAPPKGVQVFIFQPAGDSANSTTI